MTPRAATPVQSTNADEDNENSSIRGKLLSECYTDESVNGLKRANRPPDLDLSPGRTVTLPIELANQKLANVAVIESLRNQSAQGDFDPGRRSSTPTKHSGSISERVSLVYKKNVCKSVVYAVSLISRLTCVF